MHKGWDNVPSTHAAELIHPKIRNSLVTVLCQQDSRNYHKQTVFFFFIFLHFIRLLVFEYRIEASLLYWTVMLIFYSGFCSCLLSNRLSGRILPLMHRLCCALQVEVDWEKINDKIDMELQKEASRPGAKPYNGWWHRFFACWNIFVVQNGPFLCGSRQLHNYCYEHKKKKVSSRH